MHLTLWLRRVGYRQLDHEPRPPKAAWVEFKGAPVVVDDAPADAEPYTRTVLGGVKGVEYPISMDVGNPGA